MNNQIDLSNNQFNGQSPNSPVSLSPMNNQIDLSNNQFNGQSPNSPVSLSLSPQSILSLSPQSIFSPVPLYDNIIYPDVSGVFLYTNKKYYSAKRKFYIELAYNATINIHLNKDILSNQVCSVKVPYNGKCYGKFKRCQKYEILLQEVTYHGDSIIYTTYNSAIDANYYKIINNYINKTNLKLVLTTNSKQKYANISVTDGKYIYWVSNNFIVDPTQKLCMCLVETYNTTDPNSNSVMLCIYQYKTVFDPKKAGVPVYMVGPYNPNKEIPCKYYLDLSLPEKGKYDAPAYMIPGYWTFNKV
jgi:hypothetical protein